MFVKKATKVRVIAGKDKGVEAVLTALPKVNKVVVEGVNIIKKHQRPNNENPQGAIVGKKKHQPMLLTFKFWTKTVLLDVLATNL